MSTDRVRDPFERHLGCAVSAPAKHRSPFLQFLSTVKSHGQHCAEGKSANSGPSGFTSCEF